MTNAQKCRLVISAALLIWSSALLADDVGETAFDFWAGDTHQGLARSIVIDTDEGTWMSLDAHPDDSTLVFDLLGDLYLLSPDGGEATVLTEGPAWDMQPRFSPDGRAIAFISDRDGANNIWTIDLDTNEVRQVSDEYVDAVSNPSWSPDGTAIAARKGSNRRATAGSGEIWVYPVEHGEARRVVARPTFRRDLGEPAYSADGQDLYYSEDTLLARHEHRNPHQQIYEIKKVDIASGRTQTVISGPGGAISPAPSPDGRYLAFIRRSGQTSSLYVRDLKTARETRVYGDLDRDLQEHWGHNGLYPQYSWAPDSHTILFWARGKLHSVERDGRNLTDIPFRVRQRHLIRRSARFPVEVAPPEFNVRMPQSLAVSPDGKLIAYEALGRIYLKSVDDGSIRPLTNQNATFELDPSFSGDGNFLVFATWDDATLGSVKIIQLDNNNVRTIVDGRGHFVEPRLDPAGEHVVFRRTGAGELTDPAWTANPGIYLANTDGGPIQRIYDVGVSPQFDVTGERIFLSRPNENARHSGHDLVSIALNGTDETLHAASDISTAYWLSPDNRWLAFRAGYSVHAVPFELSEPALELRSDNKWKTQSVLSRSGGHSFGWIGDSDAKIFWSSGPNVQTATLPDQTPAATRLSADRHDRTLTSLQHRVPYDRPDQSIALVGPTVLTMQNDEAIKNAAIVIEGNRITAVGPSSTTRIPDDAAVVNITGKTVIPGLIDVHWHGSLADSGIAPEQNWQLLATLALGVTTIHDPAPDSEHVFAVSELLKAGRVIGPRLFSTGPILFGAESARQVEIHSMEDARMHARRLASLGAVSIKSYTQPRRDQRQMILAAAREEQLLVVAEAPGAYAATMTMVVDGHTGIEHSLPLEQIYDDVLQLWGETNVGYTPTLVGKYAGLYGLRYWYGKTSVLDHALLSRYVPLPVLRSESLRRDLRTEGDYGYRAAAEVAKSLHDAGVGINLGSHGEREGLAAHWEIWSMAQGGLSPIDALQAATIDSARYLGLDGDLGTVEAGKLADLVVLDSDPRENLQATDEIDLVVLNGRLYDPETMNELKGAGTERQPLFWE